MTKLNAKPILPRTFIDATNRPETAVAASNSGTMDGLITIVARVRSARAVLGWQKNNDEALQGVHICSTIEALMRPEARSILKNYLTLLFLLCVLLAGIAEIISIAIHPFFNPRIRQTQHGDQTTQKSNITLNQVLKTHESLSSN